MELELKGKIAIVTGGSSGIGKATALALVTEGAHVAICARDADRLRQAAKDIQKCAGQEPLAIVADVRNVENIRSFVRQVLLRYRRVDILVNNAGATTEGSIDQVSDDTWQNSVETKVLGFMHFIREVLPLMQQQRWGRIINIVGLSAKSPVPARVVAGVVNAANLNLTKSIADQVARYNVLVNSVCVARIDTPMADRMARESATAQGISFEAAKAARIRAVPLARFGRPEEVANVVAFLASERASYITGASINVDGGSSRYIV